MERCGACAQPLTFVGFDFKGRRVLTCTANLVTRETEEVPLDDYNGAEVRYRYIGETSVPCDLTQSLYVDGHKEKAVRWWKRR